MLLNLVDVAAPSKRSCDRVKNYQTLVLRRVFFIAQRLFSLIVYSDDHNLGVTNVSVQKKIHIIGVGDDATGCRLVP